MKDCLITSRLHKRRPCPSASQWRRSEALDLLHQRGDYTDAPRPNLGPLDVDLPETGGYDLLEELNDDHEPAEIPALVLAASDDAEAVADSSDLHANAYVRKPVDPDAFLETVRDLENFRLEIVRLPPSDGDDPVGPPER